MRIICSRYRFFGLMLPDGTSRLFKKPDSHVWFVNRWKNQKPSKAKSLNVTKSSAGGLTSFISHFSLALLTRKGKHARRHELVDLGTCEDRWSEIKPRLSHSSPRRTVNTWKISESVSLRLTGAMAV